MIFVCDNTHPGDFSVAQLIEFDTPNGTIRIAARTPEDSISPVGVVEDAVAKAREGLEKSMATVTWLCDAAYGALVLTKNKPASAEVEFGLQITAKGTIYVVETQADASITIKATYNF
jgi:NTP-dependent ternary system trypsin peptidase co-occuring protein